MIAHARYTVGCRVKIKGRRLLRKDSPTASNITKTRRARTFKVALPRTVGQGLEGFVLTPRIVGERVGLHPVVVMMAVVLGGAAFGFLGVLLGVPAAVVLKVWWETLIERYRSSHFYQSS